MRGSKLEFDVSNFYNFVTWLPPAKYWRGDACLLTIVSTYQHKLTESHYVVQFNCYRIGDTKVTRMHISARTKQNTILFKTRIVVVLFISTQSVNTNINY